MAEFDSTLTEMAVTIESLNDTIIARMGSASLSEVASLLPSTHTTDAYVNEVDAALEAGQREEAFHKLSLTHSTLLHHRMIHRLYKPNKRNFDQNAGKESVNDNLPEDVVESLRETVKTTLATTNKDDTLSLLHKLPSDWTVVQITTQKMGQNYFKKIGSSQGTPGLYISRCTCGPTPQITVQGVPSPQVKDVRSIVEEMGMINRETSLLYKEHKGKYQEHCATQEDLQCRLKNLVSSMGVWWVKHWCCLLVGSLPPLQQQQLDQAASRVLANYTTNTLTSKQTILIKLLMSCPALGDSGRPHIRAGVAAVLGESVRSNSVKELWAAIKKEESVLSKLQQTLRNPVILIVDKRVETLPWEMISVLKDQPVTRMPSLHMLTLLYQHHSSHSNSVLCRNVDTTSGFYVVDPDNCLPRTQQRLKDTLTMTRWPGITARRPTHDEFKEAISTNDVFMYAGHGSGSQYMPGDVVESLVCRAMVLLFGCRSVHLEPRGRIVDPWGVVLNYLSAFCPCVVGMLWDVTDKNTDFATIDILQAMLGMSGSPDSLLANPPTDIALLVARTRRQCPCILTGAALAVYGLPLHLSSST
ncbi:hypothetical protein Pcinc_027002 [Petrolisthes cinctipes]|uniref:separase n=1 Tax=Petrolisthes cinctipes TaxID=88211 RepID=A0AAE1K7C1_PETCI|nr:hypothetical protein Pcinc_027002 [Petrolisthes cinctipes]